MTSIPNSERGSFLLELIVALGISLLIATSVGMQFTMSLKGLMRSTVRVERRNHINGSLSVASSWINQASATNIYSAKDETSPAASGNYLKITLGGVKQAWFYLDNSGFWLDAPDGSRIMLSGRIRGNSTPAFSRVVPTSPWDDQEVTTKPVYTDPFARTGMVLINFSIDGSANFKRGLVNLGP